MRKQIYENFEKKPKTLKWRRNDINRAPLELPWSKTYTGELQSSILNNQENRFSAWDVFLFMVLGINQVKHSNRKFCRSVCWSRFCYFRHFQVS